MPDQLKQAHTAKEIMYILVKGPTGFRLPWGTLCRFSGKKSRKSCHGGTAARFPGNPRYLEKFPENRQRSGAQTRPGEMVEPEGGLTASSDGYTIGISSRLSLPVELKGTGEPAFSSKRR